MGRLETAQLDAELLIEKGIVTEAELEQKIDRLVQRKLETDSAYRHAPDAETQAEREQEITDTIYIDTVGRLFERITDDKRGD